MSFTALTVSVPTGKEPELLAFAASLAKRATDGTLEEAEDDEVPGQQNGKRRWGWGRKAVVDAYYGGISNVWRPFLEYLADRPDEWVAWSDLCAHINRTPRKASGMLGAAERRCSGRPPYEKKWEGSERKFRMPSQVAVVVNELRGEEQFS